MRHLALLAAVAASMVALPAAAHEATSSARATCAASAGYAEDFDGRRTFLWRPVWFEALAKNENARSRLLKEAEAALRRGPYSVTDKPKPVPGATLQDYASIGPYWWPDPKKAGGLPYYRRDGEVNPERDGPEFDKGRMRTMSDDVRSLAIAYYLTGEERFAEKAAQLLRIWFIDSEKRMNPNMDFAQGIPGRVKGRGEGIIEASHLSTVVESIGLLRPSTALAAEDHAAIEAWFREFTLWLATSDNGVHEMNKHNNHGVFFDFYLAHFALYARLDSVAEKMADGFLTDRIAIQMDKQGRFLEELKRTRSWHYSHYVVEAATRLATISECVNRDLWTHQLTDGRGLQTAKAFLSKYWSGEVKWPFKDTRLDAGKDLMEASNSVGRVRLMYARTTPPPADDVLQVWDDIP